MKKVFMIFSKLDSENACSDKHFISEAAANDYIETLEAEDKEQGIFEPSFYTVKDMTRYFAR